MGLPSEVKSIHGFGTVITISHFSMVDTVLESHVDVGAACRSYVAIKIAVELSKLGALQRISLGQQCSHVPFRGLPREIRGDVN